MFQLSGTPKLNQRCRFSPECNQAIRWIYRGPISQWDHNPTVNAFTLRSYFQKVKRNFSMEGLLKGYKKRLEYHSANDGLVALQNESFC